MYKLENISFSNKSQRLVRETEEEQDSSPVNIMWKPKAPILFIINPHKIQQKNKKTKKMNENDSLRILIVHICHLG